MTENGKVSYTLRLTENVSKRIEEEAERRDISKAALIKTVLYNEFGNKSNNQ